MSGTGRELAPCGGGERGGSGAMAWLRRLRAGWSGLGGLLAEERDRWALWLPVALGVGVAAYFALPAEPPIWAGPGVAAVAAAAVLALRGRGPVRLAVVALLAIAIGFTAGQSRTARVAAPMLTSEVGPVRVEGRVVARDDRPDGSRVVLDRLTLDRLPADRWPERVRVKLEPGDPPPPTGARIDVIAMLIGPGGPAMPGGFDFRRKAFFEGIGGVGYALTPSRQVAPPEPGGLAVRLERARLGVAARVGAHVDGQAGALATALLTGERGGIDETTYAAMRDSGLAHLLAISGLHVGLIAGLVFFAVRGGLALIEPVALRWPIKKWAAGAALLAAFGYMLIVGATVPTQRAFLMTGLVLFAILVDRTALSMRLVAWAAAAVLLLAPDSLLGPSFQMSFAAVMALIATYEALGDRPAAWRAEVGWIGRALIYFGFVAVTTLVASAATSVFGLYHFQRLATYGIAANLVAVPLTAFWIMPWGLAAYALMPLGLEGLALAPMGWGLDRLLAVARLAAAWPGAALPVPAMPAWGLAVTALGGLWLCLWQRRWRLWGAAGPVIGLAAIWLAEQPLLLVNDMGTLVGLRGEGGRLVVSTDRRDGFVRDQWLQRLGRDPRRDLAVAFPAGASPADGLACDREGCVWRPAIAGQGPWPAGQGPAVALPRTPSVLEEDCGRADVLVASFAVPDWCAAPVILDRIDVWARGAHALYPGRGGGLVVRSTAEASAGRPWGHARR